MIDNVDDLPKVNFSKYLSDNVQYDYAHLASTFTETEGKTIKHYLIQNKIECVKELIIFDENNLTEIEHKLQYRSVAALSN